MGGPLYPPTSDDLRPVGSWATVGQSDGGWGQWTPTLVRERSALARTPDDPHGIYVGDPAVLAELGMEGTLRRPGQSSGQSASPGQSDMGQPGQFQSLRFNGAGNMVSSSGQLVPMGADPGTPEAAAQLERADAGLGRPPKIPFGTRGMLHYGGLAGSDGAVAIAVGFGAVDTVGP